MIFSIEKWDEGKEIRPFVSVAQDTEFETFEAPLRAAWDAFLMPLMGETLTDNLISFYQKADASAAEKQFVYLSQRACAYLAMWYSFDELNTYISDGGMFRPDGDTRKTLYKYQQQALKDTWKNKGFNALDELLAYLESKPDDFTNFASCPGNTLFRSAIVRNTQDVDDYCFINRSRLVFLRLLPHFRTVERTIVAPRLGEIYSNLLAELGKATPDEKYIKLRNALVPVVVNYAASRLMRETGSLTDRGLFFETLTQTEDMVTTSPVSDDRMMMQATMAEGDAIAYWRLVEIVLKAEFEYTASSAGRVPKRNNNDKKAFWG